METAALQLLANQFSRIPGSRRSASIWAQRAAIDIEDANSWNRYDMLSVTKIPKIASKADAGKQRLGLFQRVASPFWFQLVLVPVISKPPALFRRETRASANVTTPTPTIDVLFCTED